MRDSESIVNPEDQIAIVDSIISTSFAVKNPTRTRIASNYWPPEYRVVQVNPTTFDANKLMSAGFSVQMVR
jgi:hypothetical protein